MSNPDDRQCVSTSAWHFRIFKDFDERKLWIFLQTALLRTMSTAKMCTMTSPLSGGYIASLGDVLVESGFYSSPEIMLFEKHEWPVFCAKYISIIFQ